MAMGQSDRGNSPTTALSSQVTLGLCQVNMMINIEGLLLEGQHSLKPHAMQLDLEAPSTAVKTSEFWV